MSRLAVQERGLLRNREQTYQDFRERRPAILEIGEPSLPESRENIDRSFDGRYVLHSLDSTGISTAEWEAAGFRHCYPLDYRSVFHLVRWEQVNR